MNLSIKRIEIKKKELGKAHRAQPINRRNTVTVPNKERRQRSRAWLLTLNNYTKEDIGTLTQQNAKIKKYIFQEEKGMNGTPHLQGAFYMNNPVGLYTMKGIHPTAHWEVCRNWNATVNYCSKNETRCGDIYRMGIKNMRKNANEKIIGIGWNEIMEQRVKWLIDETYENIKNLCIEIGHKGECSCCVKPPTGDGKEGASPPIPANSSPPSHPGDGRGSLSE